MSFQDLKNGDVLLKFIREVGVYGSLGFYSTVHDKWAMREYVEVVVENVSRAFYWVDGVKYRKDERGSTLGGSKKKPLFILPFDEHGVPVHVYSKEEIERTELMMGKLSQLFVLKKGQNRIIEKFFQLSSLEEAAELAERAYSAELALQSIYSELDEKSIKAQCQHQQ